MGKQNMNDLLKKRMASTKQASELAASDEAYEKIFREPAPAAAKAIADLPLDLLDPFRTADIGFKPYPEHKLQAFAEQLQTEGLLVRIIVRPKADGRYEILAGHNRTSAAKLAGWTKIAAEIVEADDARAIVIATSTNLIQRQQLSIVERGKAYKALLDAKNRQGQRLPSKSSASICRRKRLALTANALSRILKSSAATRSWRNCFWNSFASASDK